MLKMLYAVLLTLLVASVSAQEASIASASSSKCLEVRDFANIKDGNAVQMLVEQDLMISITDLIVRNVCDNSTAQIWQIFSGLTQVKLADPNLNFCIDAVDGQYISLLARMYGISDCLLTVDGANPVVVRECSEVQEQQWVFADDGLLTLANNTSSSHRTALFTC